MLKRLFGQANRSRQTAVVMLYGQIVAAARQKAFYGDWHVPDTPLGRFEMLALHMILFIERMQGGGKAFDALAQELTDMFFADIEDGLRELGIGDMGVPKRIKRLAKMFYGRVGSYRAALSGDDIAAMAEALRRNVRPETPAWTEALALAAYALEQQRCLAAQADAAILSGKAGFRPAMIAPGVSS